MDINKSYKPVKVFWLPIIAIALMMHSPVITASQANFELLINALESENLQRFTKLLDDGTDSDFVGEGYSPSRWVNCQAARKKSDIWLATIKNHGGNLNYVRQEHLSHMGRSRYANALVCSVINGSIEPFRFLVSNGAVIDETVCPLCKQEIGKRSLLEFATSFRQFNKSAWLLENYPEVKRQINEKVIYHLELQSTLRKDREIGFWKTVDLVRANGHTVNPKVKR